VIIDSSPERPTDFQIKQARKSEELDGRHKRLYVVHRETRDPKDICGPVSSEHWYMVAAPEEDAAIEVVSKHTDKEYSGNWCHEFEIDYNF
jgi:hypothetical protein